MWVMFELYFFHQLVSYTYNYSFSGLIRIEDDLWILRSTRTEVTVVEYKMIFEAKYLVTRILQTQLYKICPNSYP